MFALSERQKKTASAGQMSRMEMEDKVAAMQGKAAVNSRADISLIQEGVEGGKGKDLL